MKRQLLLLLALLSFGFSSAQMGNALDFTLCGGSEFHFGDQTMLVLGNYSSNDYSVTYHMSLVDAEAGVNPLPDPYLVTVSYTIFVRVTQNANPSIFETTSFLLTVSPVPVVPDLDFTVCDSDALNDGFALVDASAVLQQVNASSPDSATITTSLYASFSDAHAATNPINAMGFVNTSPYNQTIFVRAISTVNSACYTVSEVHLIVVDCNSNCVAPGQMAATEVAGFGATLGWTENNTPAATIWEVLILPAGQVPGLNAQGTISPTNPFTVTGLTCGVAYNAFVRSICSETALSGWSQSASFTTVCESTGGWPINLAMCSDTGEGCFDLTQNDSHIIGTLDPAEYLITYHPSLASAENNSDAIATPTSYCITQSGPASLEIFARLEALATGQYQVVAFALTVRHVIASNFTPTPMAQCDNNNDGIVIFDLTAVAAQLNASGPLTYYTNSTDATSLLGANSIVNPSAYQITSGVQTATIFVRENIAGNCDNVYSLQLFASPNCNLANTCSGANSLCGSLGAPFNNTVNGTPAQSGIDYGCLFSQPNATWFYIPVNQSGSLSFHISQQDAGGTGLDVDFICWGPFTNPMASCGPAFLNPANQVGCSYSAAPTESFTIANAVSGQYYVLMVTNFSNQPGLITILQTNAGAPDAAVINCTGIKMTAFLDGNANGAREPGEPSFGLGQFHYEKNGDGNVHHITSPTGSYSIFDVDASNSYDFGFDIDPAYSGNYAVTTPSFTDVHVIPGMSEYYFPVTVTNPYNDLAVTIIPGQSPRPGFAYTNTVKYTNLGSQTVAAGTVTFAKPAMMTITNISQTGTSANPTGFSYGFANLLPFETREIIVTMLVPTIPTVNIGDWVTSTASIEPLASDVAPENNTSVSSQIIIGSYDPNDKMESRGERILITDFTADDYLYYTIRFENTGTAPALKVSIADVLESKLDQTTVRMVDASHDYILDRTGNILRWDFLNIQLPSTNVDPDGGKGYVMFKVKPKPGFAVGDIIQNTAGIFFDFNPPIITNTFMSEFVQTLAVPAIAAGGFSMYPNPAADNLTVTLNDASEGIVSVLIYDLLGKAIAVANAAESGSTAIDVSQISSGIYLVEVTTTNAKSIKKLVIR